MTIEKPEGCCADWTRLQWQRWYIGVLYSDDIIGLGEALVKVEEYKGMNTFGAFAAKLKSPEDHSDLCRFCTNVATVVTILHVSTYIAV